MLRKYLMTIVSAGALSLYLMTGVVMGVEEPVVTQEVDTQLANTETQVPEAPVEEITKKYKVTVNILNLRSTMSTASSATIISRLTLGTVVTLKEDLGDWILVTSQDGKEGYLFKQHVAEYSEPIFINDKEVLKNNIVQFALQYKGTAYRSGGTNLGVGVDCSGFTQSVMKKFGISLNRVSRDQTLNGVAVSFNELEKGDLVFYGYGSRISHVGIYIGDGNIIHASTGRRGVVVDRVNGLGSMKILAYRRVII